MTAQQIQTCATHGESTRITCVDCGEPICPKCLVRTEVGHKCESCAAPSGGLEPQRPAGRRGPSRRRWPLSAAAGGLVLLGIAVAVLLLGDGDDPAPTELTPVGQWTDVPDLQTIRGTPTATVLDDGRVLVAGGGVSAIALAATEVYDPAAGAWEVLDPMAQARRGHRAVRLDDGRVLVAGGIAEGEVLASAEVFDPATGGWSPTGSMTIPRLAHTLTVLPDGRVLALGGTTPGGQSGTGGGQAISPSAAAEVYDPDVGTWARIGEMSVPRFEHTATRLEDGRVLVAGGLGGAAEDGAFMPQAGTEFFDPAVSAFTQGPQLATGRSNHAAVLRGDGTVVVVGGVGGRNGQEALAAVEVYDPSTGGWGSGPSLRRARSGLTATLLGDDAVLVAGGEAVQGGSRRSLESAELLPAGADAWSSAGSMGCPRSEHAAVSLGGDVVLAVAGDAAFPGEPPVAQGCATRYDRAASSGGVGGASIGE